MFIIDSWLLTVKQTTMKKLFFFLSPLSIVSMNKSNPNQMLIMTSKSILLTLVTVIVSLSRSNKKKSREQTIRIIENQLNDRHGFHSISDHQFLHFLSWEKGIIWFLIISNADGIDEDINRIRLIFFPCVLVIIIVVVCC